MEEKQMEQKGVLLQKAVREIMSKASDLNKYAFDVARQICLIKEKGLWKFEDSTQPFRNFEQWYEYSGIPVKWDTLRQWIRTYKELVVKLGYTPAKLADIDFYKLRLVCSVALQDASKVPMTLDMARKLSYRDLFLAIKQEGLEIDACTHPNVEEVISYRCTTCHQMFRQKPEERLDGNELSQAIDNLIQEFLDKTELHETAESIKTSRQYASLLIKKYPRQMISDCLDDLLADKFWKDKLCKLSQLYREMPRFERDDKPINETE